MSELPSKKDYLIPDWMSKSFLVLATWVLAIEGARLLFDGISSGRIEALGSAVYSVDESSASYAFYVLMLLLGEFGLLIAAIVSLGFVPPIGRSYKRLYERRNLTRSGGRDRE